MQQALHSRGQQGKQPKKMLIRIDQKRKACCELFTQRTNGERRDRGGKRPADDGVALAGRGWGWGGRGKGRRKSNIVLFLLQQKRKRPQRVEVGRRWCVR